ncbi:MAG: polysaccharide deacetylase family protein [Spirochaetaceae bacterium]|nr:MAG: polysaccharide deacetylase family protein [Spirochaetaceae bacterium]
MRHLRLYNRLFVIALVVLAAGCRSLPLPETEPAVEPDRPTVAAEVLRWRDGARSAASLTFDDSTLDHYLLAAPELDSRGLRGTFYAITGVLDEGIWHDGDIQRLQFSWSQAREMAARGHEIGSHSHNHPDLTTLDLRATDRQLRQSMQRLRHEIPQQRGLTFAWPYWRSNSVGRALATHYYIAARAGQATTARYIEAGVPGARPADLQRVNALAVRPVEASQSWIEAAERVLDSEGWAVLSLHGVDDGRIPRAAVGWQPLSIETYRGLLDYLVGQDFWIAPFADVVKYIERRDSTQLTVRQLDESSVSIDILCELDPSVYDIPLSLKLELPRSWREVQISADGVALPWRSASPAVQLELPLEAQRLTIWAIAD